jgi:hypothetical protein
MIVADPAFIHVLRHKHAGRWTTISWDVTRHQCAASLPPKGHPERCDYRICRRRVLPAIACDCRKEVRS